MILFLGGRRLKIGVYGYARISRDEDKENYDTIVMQKRIIKRYANEKGWNVINTFDDDNISGYTFNRDGLNDLKKLIEAGQVSILLSKDASRIGRHNAKTLLFLEYLEDYNVRLILIHDNYDSAKDEDDIIGIKTWYNEKYIKDISKKIKANLSIKQVESGLITKVPFGYKRSDVDRHRLIVDDEAADVVRRIFQLYIDGHGGRRIANILNDEGIPTPSKYQYIKTGKKIAGSVAEKWTGTHAMRIIQNDVYIGVLRCRKTERRKINGKTYRVEENKHIVHENFHEPIISVEDFELAQKIVKNRTSNNVRGNKTGINLFTGFLKCKDCGGGFMKVNKKKSPPSYICTNNHLYGASSCSSHKIHEEQLKVIILDKLKLMRASIEDNLDKLDKEINELASFNVNYEKAISKYNKNIRNKKEEIKNYSRQLAKGLIEESIASEMIIEANNELKNLSIQLEELLKLKEINSSLKEKAISSLDVINEIIKSENLTRRNLEKLIKYITIEQLNQSKPGIKPILNISIEWDVFISSVCNIIELYDKTINEYTLPCGWLSGFQCSPADLNGSFGSPTSQTPFSCK